MSRFKKDQKHLIRVFAYKHFQNLRFLRYYVHPKPQSELVQSINQRNVYSLL